MSETTTQHTYLDELNDIQRQAVTAIEGPVMVIAGPGSGKTRVLTYRIAHLIQSGVAPWEILTLTFTNKAAREMKERIEKVVGSRANKVWAGTFHSIFSRILRYEAHRIGYPNDFTIYDTSDTDSVISEILTQMGLDKKQYNKSAVRSRISMAKSNLITPKAYALNEELMGYDTMNRRPMIHMIYQKYVNKCLRSGAMDFDDLLLQMFRLLYQNPDGVLEKYRSAFQYVLVDEFQDTNYLQYQIIKLLVKYPDSKENVCIVGDDAQSIYSFRGATIENILQFEKDFPEVRTYKLEQNYRSTHHIVQAANQVISYNDKQIKKEIWTDKDEGEKIKVFKCMSDNEEGRRVADGIIEQKHRYNLSNSDISILYRTNAQSRVFEEHLRRHNIPYKIYGGLSFYQRKEIKDMLSYLRLAVNPKDNEALKRVINYPKRGIGKTSVDKLAAFAEEQEMSMFEAIPHLQISRKAYNLMNDFRKLIESFQAKAQKMNAYDLAVHISKQSGILMHLKSDDSMEGMGRLENLTSLLDGINEFINDDELAEGEDANQDKSIASYLQSIALITDFDNEGDEEDFVTLMSAHAAKGLEFKSVFVVGLEENLFPSFMSMSDPTQIDEERRLFYVAITRAEQYLTLSYANSRYQFGNMRFNDPSRFLEEIAADNVDSAMPAHNAYSHEGFGTPRLLGNFKKLQPKKEAMLAIDPSTFKASPSHHIKEGHDVMHLKFGKGHVQSIDGERDNKVATIIFEQLDNPERRIMLRFAKLQILDEA
ncbi:ATP-dependent helicase [Portibacter marinus]|uniref:ATP-dependent helicase n=1 Tax=Portibacter marinus TaxID=2898660 RepID=UPI001F208730|nr:UvrD-helicase domain-containing protein [Portibacter marinus]